MEDNNILTNKNKELLWNILKNNNIFNNIPESKFLDVKNLFENIVMQVAFNSNPNNNLVHVNKIILKNLISEINTFKENLLNSQTTKSDFKNEKIVLFDKSLEKHQESFNNLDIKKPDEIDFSDKQDEPIEGDEMNKILKRMSDERKIEFFQEDTKNTIMKTDDKLDILADNKDISNIKITSFQELTETNYILDDNDQNDNNQNNNNDYDKNYSNNFDRIKRNNSKIDKKDIDKFIQEEYKNERESLLSGNQKIDKLMEYMEKILKNQELILSKLN